jgi:hypothetical protein
MPHLVASPKLASGERVGHVEAAGTGEGGALSATHPPAPCYEHPLRREPPRAPRPSRGGCARLETFKVGDVILDKYEVTGVLGQGGMGLLAPASCEDRLRPPIRSP